MKISRTLIFNDQFLRSDWVSKYAFEGLYGYRNTAYPYVYIVCVGNKVARLMKSQFATNIHYLVSDPEWYLQRYSTHSRYRKGFQCRRLNSNFTNRFRDSFDAYFTR